VNLNEWTIISKTPSNVTEMFTVTSPLQIASSQYLVNGGNCTPKYKPNATTGYNGFSLDDTNWYTIEKNALNETVDIALWDCVS
jgi:hypothetical protein